MVARGPRYAAMQANELTYVADKPCKHGHTSPRITANGRCTECFRTEEHMQRYRDNTRNRMQSNPRLYLFESSRRGSKDRGIPFDLKLEDIPEIPDICPILGIKLTQVRSGRENRNTSPSLDRIRSSEGYIPGNVHIISWRANQIKLNATFDEVRRLYEWMCIHSDIIE